MVRHPELPERDRRILGAVVQAYIDQGEPVSSLWLASRGFGVSSATLRNIMARLEDLGLRPAAAHLGRTRPDRPRLSELRRCAVVRAADAARHAPQMEARLRRAGSVEDLMTHLSQELSRASHQVGFAIAPAVDATTLERLDFVPLDGGRVLVDRRRHRRPHLAQGDRAQRRLRPDGAAAGRQLPEQRVQGAVAARRCGRRCSIGCARSGRSTTSLLARALRLASSTFADLDSAPTLFVQGASLLLDDVGGRGAGGRRSRRCERCCG